MSIRSIAPVLAAGFLLLFPRPGTAEVQFPFQGEINLQKKEFRITIHPEGEHPLSIQLARTGDQLYRMDANVDHLPTPFFDISTVLEGTLELARPDPSSPPVISGKVMSKYTLINYKPVKEFVGQFEVRNGSLEINSLLVGNVFCKGGVGLKPPFPLNLAFQLSGVDINDFLYVFVGQKKLEAQGDVIGDILVSGTLGELALEGKLATYNGFVTNLNYRSILVNAQGTYPVIEVAGTNITQEDGMTFNIAGNLDLSDKDGLAQQIKALSKEPLISDDGVEREWTLKRLSSEDKSGTTEFKYLFRKGDDSKNTEQDAAMIGVERKMEF